MDALLDPRRDEAGRRQRALYDGHLHRREFTRAAALRTAHPALGLPAVPEILDLTAGEPRTALFVRADSAALERRAVDLGGRCVLVAFHPACRHSVAAYRAIAADPLLSRVFADRAIWLAPFDALRDADALRHWAERHPTAEVGIAWSRDEWRGFPLHATPAFHFVGDGRLEGTVEGAAGAALVERLLAAVNMHGWIAKDGHAPAGRAPAAFESPALPALPYPRRETVVRRT